MISAPRRSRIFFAMAVPSILVAAIAGEVVVNCLTKGIGGLRVNLGGFERQVCKALEAVDAGLSKVGDDAVCAEGRAV